MTTQSTTETAPTDNGTTTETDGGAGTETNGTPSEKDGDAGTGSEPTEEDGRLKKLRQDLDAKTARLKELEEAEAERQRAEMSEMDKLKADLAARDDELAELKANALRSRIAAEYELPTELADRLKGSDEDELKADAAELAKLIPKRKPTPSPDAAGIGGKDDQAPTDPRELHRNWIGRR